MAAPNYTRIIASSFMDAFASAQPERDQKLFNVKMLLIWFFHYLLSFKPNPFLVLLVQHPQDSYLERNIMTSKAYQLLGSVQVCGCFLGFFSKE